MAEFKTKKRNSIVFIIENYNVGTFYGKQETLLSQDPSLLLQTAREERPTVRWLKRNCFAIRCVLTDHACLHEKSLIQNWL